MINEIMKYNCDEFYQEKSELIGNSVRRYAELKKDNNASDEELLKIKNESEETINTIMIENGFCEEEDACISIDKEFINENGELDNERLEEFQKMMMLRYADQQLKWTFAGTTSLFSPITKRIINEQGEDYAELLPLKLKKDILLAEKEKHINNKDSDFHIFLYIDGTVSDRYIPKKSSFSFDKLKDRSGFDWSKGYSPKNEVLKTDWRSGFNEQGEWERVYLDEEPQVLEAVNIAYPGIFTDDYIEHDDSVGFLSIPESEEAFLFDSYSILKDGKEEMFFSITGEQYCAREIDKDSTIEAVKHHFKKNNIDKITNIVIGDISKDTIAYYKEKFSEYVTDNTRFYSRGDKELREKLILLKKEVEEKDISHDALSGLFSLSERGLKGEELYKALRSSILNNEYEVNLNIFSTKDDLETFVSIPEINEELDNETENYLHSVTVPDDKKKDYSNAVQNILHNYDNLFRHANVEKAELLKIAYDVIVNNDPGKAKDIHIIREKNLYNYIKENAIISKETEIPSFNRAFKNENDYYNITDKNDLKKWVNGCTITQGINNTTNAGSENNLIKVEDLSEDNNEIRGGQSLSIEQVPESGQYTEIIDPENQSFINNTDDSSIEKNIPKIVSGGLQDEGISEEIFEKIEEMISNTSVPSGKEELYSRSMQNTFSEFKSIRNSTGMPAPELASIIYDIIVNEKIDDQYVNKSVYFEKDLESLIKESAKANPHKVKIRKDDINLTGETDYPYENRSDLSTETDLNTFLLSPAFKESGLTESEGEEITSYLKDVEIPSNSIMDLNRGVINIIKSHRNDIAPKNIAPIEAVKAVVHAVKGDHDKVPIEIREEIYSSISRENTRGIPVEHDRTGETKGRDREFIFPISEPDLSNYNIPADLDLSNDEDLNTFAHSPFMRESGLSDSESEEIVSYLRNTKTPPERSKDLTRGIVHTIRSYESNIAPKNITPIDAVKAVTHAVKGEHENVPLEIRDEIYNSISKKDAPDIPNEHDMSGETEKKYREFISPISNQDTGLDFSSFNLPDNFDLSNEEDINTFAKSPFMRENGLTDSDEKEIVSYLKNAKAPRERANDFTQGITQIIRSYKNNIAPKNITPIEAVKAVSHAVKGEHHRVPKEIENEIYKSLGERKFYASPIESWNNDEIFTSLSSEDGMEIDLLNRKDLNTFAQSSLMRNSGISETESDEIISYLKKAKIPIQSRQAFSNGVFNTLRSYKMDIAPHEINPADAVRSIGYAIHGQHDKIPEKIRPMILKNVLHEDRYNKQEQIPKINLMQNRGIDDFVDTQKFKQTGMLKEQFNELLSLHKGSYKGIQKEYYDHISVKYKSIKTGNGDNTANFNMPINANIQPSEQGNNIYNIGWHTKQHGQGPRMIKFTDLGNKKLNSLQKKGIAYGMKRDIQARKDSPPVINTISNKSGPIFEENIKSIPIGSPIASSKTSPVASPISSPITKDKNYIFTDPFASGKTKGNSVISQLPRLNSRQRIKTVDSMEKYSNQPYPAKSLTEEDKMKRIEDHYHEDKRMLAKTSSTESAYNRVQQSRTSNKYDISELLDTTISIIKNGITDE